MFSIIVLPGRFHVMIVRLFLAAVRTDGLKTSAKARLI